MNAHQPKILIYPQNQNFIFLQLRNERELPNGYVRAAVVYSIIASEWLIIKEQLLQTLAVYK